jgi:cell division protein FtsZ
MSIKLQLPKLTDMRPRLTVMGVGGAGCNAINNMIASGLTGVDFIVANTDAQALSSSSAEHRIQLGATLTEGLGAGSKPEVGEAAAEEATEDLRTQIAGSHMLFIAAGMGGGTGTGAATVVAKIAREMGILTVAIVTKPFQFEGARRQRIAEIGIAELKQYVDTLIVIPNQNLFRVANERTTFAEAFVLADQVLYSGVACIVDLIIKEGLINLDFADVRTVLSGMGTAMMGTGEASGGRRAIEAAEEAISNPLLDDVSLRGARGLLLSISGGRDLTLYEVDEAASRVRAEVDPEANIIVGATFDESLGDRVRVSIVASGMMRQNEMLREPPLKPAIPLPAFGAMAPPAHPAQPVNPAPPNYAAQPPNPAPAPPPQMSEPARDVPREMPRIDFQSAESRGGEHKSQHGRPEQGYSRDGAFEGHPRGPSGNASAGNGPNTGNHGNAVDHDMQRRLSAALSATDPVDRRPSDRGSRPDVWQAPGNVMIEEAPPLAADPLNTRIPASAKPAMLDDTQFQPELGIDIRRAPKRVPEIDEFPQVAQREYHGRAETQSHPHESPVRRPGLFERLAGMTRRSDDSHHDHPSRDGSSASPRHDSAHGGRGGPPAAGSSVSAKSSQSRSQDAELPAVLRKDRR